MSDKILELQNITKYFPGIKALDGINLNIREGEVHALIGENGAGKSTLVKILTGVYTPTTGKIIYQGKEYSFKNAIDAQEAGITAIHQEASMFPELSVMENIYMGHHLKKKGALDWKEMRQKTKDLLQKMEIDINPDTPVKNLGVAQRHMVEIAKALSIDAKVVIMDEPTSALTLREVEDLYKIVRQLKKENKAIIFISHKFEEIQEICDCFTVLRDGQYIGEGNVAETGIDQIVNMMVGRSLDQMFPKVDVNIGETILEVEGLSKAGSFKDVSFELKKGEILGFFGLVGAGRSEVMRAIFGIDSLDAGTVRLKGQDVVINSAREAMQKGLAYVPEDRQTQGVILEQSLTSNITLPIIDKISRLGKVDAKAEKAKTAEFGRMMEIKAAGWHVNANTLSGGNQQKVVLAKWLATEPEILILDEPTKGIDVGTKAAVHEFISEMASKGLAVIMVSSELPEILGMSDRVVVMHEGHKTKEFSRDEADSDVIIKAATGHTVESNA
ncbi:MAG: sugar ABC transporter ATP-binding protein [Spirochaetales bacterium]|nr:sugar ABC transporter ATP-binding protein [Spirochaetales bacterium]